MIDDFPSEEMVFHIFDSFDDNSRNNYPIDFLNSITPNGLPPHDLKVKNHYPVILLRNLDAKHGLSNGTRLMVRAFQDNAIDLEIVGGHHAGKRVFIPRIPMAPSYDISLRPFKFKWRQFTLRLSFAMTINKSPELNQPKCWHLPSRAYFLTWTALCHAVKWCIEINDKNFGQTKEISRCLREEHKKYCV